jgi:hypothetical protein
MQFLPVLIVVALAAMVFGGGSSEPESTSPRPTPPRPTPPRSTPPRPAPARSKDTVESKRLAFAEAIMQATTVGFGIDVGELQSMDEATIQQINESLKGIVTLGGKKATFTFVNMFDSYPEQTKDGVKSSSKSLAGGTFILHPGEEVSLSSLKLLGHSSGGGTDFRPIFEKVEALREDRPDMLIVFTDGMGTYPESAPSIPLFWLSPLEEPIQPDFGIALSMKG